MIAFHVDTVNSLIEVNESALIQLVYTSNLTVKGRFNTSVFNEVEGHARTYNKQQGITGILCYGNGQFLQCIEGRKAEILRLQQRIFSDKRHKNTKVLLVKAIDKRNFSDWRMRLLFLERWLWSPATKQQATQLSPFLPFSPRSWTPEQTQHFLQTMQAFENTPHIKATGMTYNALGNMFRHMAAPHQAFLVVQGILAVLLLIALLLLFY
ncbi:BLUF domain-containing protein [Psychrobacter sp. TAE2020]|uniref:BLUF domain-containing protein n=1 Tax=Psychrobacter sp. TAE2020 TaxID=2846762 RepID=UPI001C10DDF9|nr:BLUF domain-containing protein [Psychrobacter sp. TAE2020]MBU5616688.1 BLUF domain-containing protein [Psychrobacter sp. TAE2020]